MGDTRKDALRVDFDRSIKLGFHGSTIISNGGLLAYRDLDEVFALTAMAEEVLSDLRTGSNVQHSLTALLRQSIYSRLAGYDDTNDAERLSVDPVMRQVVGGRAVDRRAASTSQMARFETDVLTQRQNLSALRALSGKWVDGIRLAKPIKKIILDLDSSVSETYGQQEGSAYNGYFRCQCYHPVFCFNQDGDVEAALLRNGNVASAHDWRLVLVPVIDRYRDLDIAKLFRGDAAFAIPELYEFLEAEGYRYAIRVPANNVLYREIAHLMRRPVGRPPAKPIVLYHRFEYQAASWNKPRTVAAKVEWHCDELFPRVGFVVTNMRGGSKPIIDFYNGRGRAEQAIKEGKVAVNWTRLSCHDFVDNQVRLQLFALAYNLGNFLRRLALPASVRHWTLTTLLLDYQYQTNPCLSQEGVFQANLQIIRDCFDNKPAAMPQLYRTAGKNTFGICLNDNGNWCRCVDCARQYDSDVGTRGFLSKYFWDYTNRLAREVRKTHSHVQLIGLAYTDPPKDTVFESNTGVMICRMPNRYWYGEYKQQDYDHIRKFMDDCQAGSLYRR